MLASQNRRNQSSANDSDESLDPEQAQPPRYVIYLLTVWLDEARQHEPSQWRFRLENPRTKEAKGFVGVEELVAGLVELVKESSKPF